MSMANRMSWGQVGPIRSAEHHAMPPPAMPRPAPPRPLRMGTAR
jgi:hypothetical protein